MLVRPPARPPAWMPGLNPYDDDNRRQNSTNKKGARKQNRKIKPLRRQTIDVMMWVSPGAGGREAGEDRARNASLRVAYLRSLAGASSHRREPLGRSPVEGTGPARARREPRQGSAAGRQHSLIHGGGSGSANCPPMRTRQGQCKLYCVTENRDFSFSPFGSASI